MRQEASRTKLIDPLKALTNERRASSRELRRRKKRLNCSAGLLAEGRGGGVLGNVEAGAVRVTTGFSNGYFLNSTRSPQDPPYPPLPPPGPPRAPPGRTGPGPFRSSEPHAGLSDYPTPAPLLGAGTAGHTGKLLQCRFQLPGPWPGPTRCGSDRSVISLANHIMSPTVAPLPYCPPTH
eukprot:768117-Hanusia_phi.AAC.11